MPEVTTFSLFVGETIQYILGIKGIEWYMDVPDEIPKGVRNVFDINFGDAIVCYLVRHDKEIKQVVKDSSFSNINEIKKIATKVITKLCKEDCFLMDVIRIIAVFADFALRCCKIDRPELIPALVDYLNSFYKKYLQEPMQVVGGYYALLRFAQQYYNYHKDDFNIELETTETRFKFGESSTSNIDKEFEALSKCETTSTEGNLETPETSDLEKELEALSKFETTFTEGNLEIPQTSELEKELEEALSKFETTFTEGNLEIPETLDFEKELEALSKFETTFTEGNLEIPQISDFEKELEALSKFETTFTEGNLETPQTSNFEKEFDAVANFNAVIREGNFDFPDAFDLEDQLVALASFESMLMEKTKKVAIESDTDKNTKISTDSNTEKSLKISGESNSDKCVGTSAELNTDKKVEPKETNTDENVDPEETKTDLNASFEIRSILRRALERDCLAAQIDYCDENASPKRRRDC